MRPETKGEDSVLCITVHMAKSSLRPLWLMSTYCSLFGILALLLGRSGQLLAIRQRDRLPGLFRLNFPRRASEVWYHHVAKANKTEAEFLNRFFTRVESSTTRFVYWALCVKVVREELNLQRGPNGS
jgi:hypothetical protein